MSPEPIADLGRNIIQSHTERPIIKTAPDFVVFIENSPYLINEYVGDPFTSVNINDYVIAANGSVDLESLIPSASVSLSVPNHLKYLFFAPGGNRLLQTMADIKIFGKGYFLNEDAETTYHRVFWGLISGTTYIDNGSTLDIEITCQGVLRMLELAQTNVQPAAMVVGEPTGQVNGFVSRWPTMNPYEQIAIAFVDQLRVDSLNRTVVTEDGDISASQKRAINQNYVIKWTEKLRQLKNGLRLFPLSSTYVDELANDTSWRKSSPKTADPNYLNEIGKRYSGRDEVRQFMDQQSFEIDKIHAWQGDYAVGNVALVQSRIVSKLERVRQWVEVLGYEGYQDLDGNLIFKPPLYNLDVCNTGSQHLSEQNPFVVHLDEIESEHEAEDERAIRATRIEVCGNISPLLEMTPELSAGYATYTDMKLVRKFGLRQEGLKKIAFLGPDNLSNFSYAVAEVAKLNRQYRTYQCTIPFRPELKLGFPAYFPHMDMYGYIRSLSWSYNVGGTASITMHCDQIRRRIMYKLPVVNKDKDGNDITTGYKFQSVPFLVHKWMKPAASKKDEPPTSEKGTPASVLRSKESMPSSKQYEVLSYLLNETKSLFMTAPDTPSYSWNVVAAADDPVFGADKSTKDVVKDKVSIANSNYLEYIRTCQPYTDCKGYELISPMPWGRGQTLRAALNAFTMSDAQIKRDPVIQEGTTQSRVAAFLFSAAGNVSIKNVSGDMENALSAFDKALKPVVDAVKGNDTYFILRYQTDAAGTQPETTASSADDAAARAQEMVSSGTTIRG